jgi:hypothetical protein
MVKAYRPLPFGNSAFGTHAHRHTHTHTHTEREREREQEENNNVNSRLELSHTFRTVVVAIWPSSLPHLYPLSRQNVAECSPYLHERHGHDATGQLSVRSRGWRQMLDPWVRQVGQKSAPAGTAIPNSGWHAYRAPYSDFVAPTHECVHILEAEVSEKCIPRLTAPRR